MEKHQGDYSQREQEKGMKGLALDLNLGCWREFVIPNAAWFPVV